MEFAKNKKKEGSALVESCLVVALLCLILFGLLQVSYLVAARDVLSYTAVTTARAASVGLNDFMLHKVSHYASIPVSGPVRIPEGFRSDAPKGHSGGAKWWHALSRKNMPASELGLYEVGAKEAYHLAPVNSFNLILDYENWQESSSDIHYEVERDDDLITLSVLQNVPVVVPFSRVFFGHLDPISVSRNGKVSEYPGKTIAVVAVVEDHAKLYLK